MAGEHASGLTATFRRRSLKRFVSPITTAVFLGLVAIVVYRRRSELVDLFDDPQAVLSLIGLLIVAGHFLNSSEFWVLYRAQGLAIGIWETWMLFLATQFGNLLPGQAGSLYRFRYLKVVYAFDYGRSGSNYGANLAITLASSALTALVGLVAVAAAGGTVSPVLMIVVAVLGAVSIPLLLVELPALPRLGGTPARAWAQFRGGWEAIRRQRAVAGIVLVLDIAKYGLVAWRFQLAFGLLDVDLSYAHFLVIAPAAGLAGAIAFTPGGFGVREVFIAAAAVGVGTALDTGLLAATVDRGVMLLTAVALGSLAFFVTRRRMTAMVAEQAETPRTLIASGAGRQALGSQSEV